MIKAVVFDLDGVLVDATEWHYEALNKALAIFGYSISREEHLSLYNGLPTRKKLELLSVVKGFPRSLHDLVSRLKQKYTREIIRAHCRPDIVKVQMLTELRNSGYTLAVCSNAIRATVEEMLELSEIRHFFSLVLSNEDISRPKPAPDIYLKAFKLLKLRPDQCAIVEDAEHGKAAARASGASLIAVDSYYQVDSNLVFSCLREEEYPQLCA